MFIHEPKLVRSLMLWHVTRMVWRVDQICLWLQAVRSPAEYQLLFARTVEEAYAHQTGLGKDP